MTTAPIAWPEAQDTVLSAYRAFSPELAAVGGRFFAARWIDAPVRPGKAPGAFAHPTVPSAHPYLLLNYQGRLRDVMTLAHELGHGVHQVLAAGQGALMADTPLTLAETASVFGEMLTFRALLARETDPARRKIMLAGKVEDMLNTVVRQIAFATFEMRVHDERREAELTADRLVRDLARGAAREPRAGVAARRRLSLVLDLHPAFHPHAVLRLRLCVRRLPGELALRGLPGRASGLRRALSRDAARRRHLARTASCWRPSASTPPTPPSGQRASASSPASSTNWKGWGDPSQSNRTPIEQNLDAQFIVST